MEIMIREFIPGDEEAFRRLNEEWINRYFKLEDKDRSMLANPQQTIIDQGGRIFLGFQDGEAVGCCALIQIAPGEYEVAKMAVTQTAQGSGIGRRLMTRIIAEAAEAGARRLYLETHHALTPAIRLYRSHGFQHLPPERIVPSVYQRADVFMERYL